MRSIVVAMLFLSGGSSAWAQHSQHSQKDAARLSAKLDEILRNADKPKHAARPRKDFPPKNSSKEPAAAIVYQPVDVQRSNAALRDNALGDVIVHAIQVAFDPDAWAVHLRELPRTPAELQAHLDRIPRTPDEIAAHLRNLPSTPDEFAAQLANLPRSPADVDAHLRRLDAALRRPRH